MVHGACSSSGCYSMTDEQIEQIYAFDRDAFRGGQTEFQIQAFPFRMTAANMARYRKDANYEFWTMLKEGYDQFEITKVPPKVDVCEKRYVFNRMPEGTATFNPTAACPPSTQPETLTTAYQSYKSSYEAAFAHRRFQGANAAPKPTIAGIKEANLVSEWSRKKAKGQRVPIEPPSLNADGTVAVTARMGRVEIRRQESARQRSTTLPPSEEKGRRGKEGHRAGRRGEEEAGGASPGQGRREPVVATGTTAGANGNRA